MKSKIGRFYCMAACIIVAVFAAGAAQGVVRSPMDIMKEVVENVFHTLHTYPVSGPLENLPKRRAAIKKIIDNHFDAREMSQRALGKYWKDISDEKRDEFTQLFYWRLYNFYIMRLEAYSDEKVIYDKERSKGNVAAVYTKVSSKRYPEFDIEYRLKQQGDDWKIYDVVIEGVSLVANYRSQFNSFLSSKSFPELLKALHEKTPQDSLK
ncbi:MAG: ABC transporter substrate-binding protein [Proteobacteria bacterium]|nr:ABC transporter substrate-binding protein [Pseudomonadota bacterium]MBU4294301.1 ABC transporter substrate-binding protein [Pseudomonadota bacterium]MCG2746114.1 ABC transporter substrate-binding protein [Desulfobulbaceae bacterium]